MILRSLTTALLACPALPAQAESPDFARDVLPVLSRNCFACHGPDKEARKAGLELHRRESAAKVLVPGNAGASEIVRRLLATDRDRMPPEKSGKALTAREIELIRRWIDEGAKWGSHWSFAKIARPTPPAVRDETWPTSAIDRFVLARLESAGLTPSPPADRATLIRRLSLDLTGLPPAPAEVAAFERDARADAYERLVDALLARPAYGEHWTRLWLDLARYADTKGYEKDRARTVWPYRDWLIRAFNADMPFDEFTRDQLAGDLVPSPTKDQLIATAFHRNTLANDEGGTDNEEFRVAAVKDRVETTIQTWMGLTMACASCHSHKYDPISQREYYELYAFFNQTADADRHDDAPTLALPTGAQREALRRIDAELAALRKNGGKPAPEERKKAIRKLEARKKRVRVTRLPIMRELAVKKRRKTHVQIRGNFLSPGEEVRAAVPAAFGPLPEGAPENRLGIARWLTHPSNR